MENFGAPRAMDKKIEQKERALLTPVSAALLASLGAAVLSDEALAADRHAVPSQESSTSQQVHEPSRGDDVFARIAQKTLEGMKNRQAPEKIRIIVDAGVAKALDAASGKPNDLKPEDFKEAGQEIVKSAVSSLLDAAIPELQKMQQSLQQSEERPK
ncbi:MAG TPA: hypothetical protein VMU25_01570 [Candidatus Paceibacterota bacterium]|nr:hypothetical protein [Candidatus Paceibacterota bacterium]